MGRASYDRISGPMEALGREVLERLELRGDELVLDAGCGSGRITEALIERLPRGRVIAVDASPSMVEAARERLGPERRRARRLDLLELELEQPSTRSSRPRPSTGSPTTSGCSRACARRCARAGGWWRSAGARATSTCCAARPTRCSRASRTPSISATGSRRGTTPAPGRRASGCSPRASPTAECWLEPAPRSPSSRASSSPRSCSARTCSSCPRACASRSWTTCWPLLGEPVVVDYVRLNIDADRVDAAARAPVAGARRDPRRAPRQRDRRPRR